MTAPRILLVDDDTRWLRSEQQHFEACGYRTVAVESAAAAEGEIRNGGFDLVVLDLMLEQCDSGIVLAHHIKKLVPHVPILMVTDLTAETGIVFKHVSAGEKRWIQVDAILAKPVRLQRLAFEAETLLGAKSLRTPAAAPHHDQAERFGDERSH